MPASVSVGTLRIEPPLLNGSGVVDAVSADEAWNLPASRLSKLGAFVTKTLTPEPRAGNCQPWAETYGPGSLVNAAGLPNPGIHAALRDWRLLPERLGVPVIVSLGGAPAQLAELASLVESAGWAAAIELNLSCPNVHGGLIAAEPAAVRDAVARVRARTTLPLFAKLTPATGDVAAVAAAAVEAGAQALTCGNTMPVRALDAAGMPLLGAGPDGGLSGSALHPIALRLVAEARAAVEVPIVGLGGVDSLAAADRMLAAGASIVGVGTGAVYDPALPDALADHLGRARARAPARA